jgi:hypothetical protein
MERPTGDLKPASAPRDCPSWCTIEHGVFPGEDDHLHTGAPLYLTATVTAFLCATVDPCAVAADGPYLFVNSEEWTLDHTRSIGQALTASPTLATDPPHRPTPGLNNTTGPGASPDPTASATAS